MKRSRSFGWLNLVKMAKEDPDALEVLQDAIEERFAKQYDNVENDAMVSSAMQDGEEWVVVFDGRRRVFTAYSAKLIRRWGVGRNSVVVWSTHGEKRPAVRRLV